MKKSVKLLSVLLAALLLGTLLGACAGASSSPEGFYKIKSINGMAANDYFAREAEDSGTDLESIRATFALLGFTGEFDEFITIELKKDNTCTISVAAEEPEESTWKLEGSTLIITNPEGSTNDFQYKDCTLTGKLSDVVYVFEKTNAK